MNKELLMDELSEIIRPYLEEKKLSREAFANRPEVSSSESTVRRLLNRNGLPNPPTILRYLKAVTKQTSLQDLLNEVNKSNFKEIEKFLLKVSPLYNQSVEKQSLEFSYTDLSNDYTTYSVYLHLLNERRH